jgi:LacI family transcriptional regulator
VVTLFDVARLAGVSTATVSRVVHGQDRVREATRIRVQQAIEELGYVPDGAAQSLSRRRKDVIGLVCVERHEQQYDIENMNLLFYDEVLRGVESRIRNHDWSLLITFLQGAHDPSYARIESFTGKVDGILIGEGIVPSPFIERLATRLPVVIFAGTPHEQAVDVVAADNLSGSAAVVTHLIREHGRRRLYWVHGPADSPDSRERRLGLDYVLHANPHCELTGFYRGSTASRAARRPARHCWPGPGASCRTRSSPPTTRWPSAWSRRCPGPASGCRRTWPWSASTTSSPAACATLR